MESCLPRPYLIYIYLVECHGSNPTVDFEQASIAGGQELLKDSLSLRARWQVPEVSLPSYFLRI
jgi:hypothetical protein